MKNLGQFANIRAGHAFRKKLTNDETARSYVLQMKDLDDVKGIDWENVVRCQPVAIKKEWLTVGDILIVARGARNHAYYIDIEPPSPTLAAPHFFHLSLVPGAEKFILAEFLAWQLNQQTIQDYFRRNAEGSTSKSIRRVIVEETPIRITSLQLQKAIVSLQQTINHERILAETLIKNGEKLMNKICTDLPRMENSASKVKNHE